MLTQRPFERAGQHVIRSSGFRIGEHELRSRITRRAGRADEVCL
jgi:hypothetical protein